MSGDIVAFADQAWHGDRAVIQEATGTPGAVYELAEGVALVTGFGNVVAFRTGEGLFLVDTSGRNHGPAVLAGLRTWDASPVRTVVYTHGHADHVGGMPFFDDEAAANSWPRPHVIAHENVPPRFDRYTRTSGYNAIINQRQFGRRTGGLGLAGAEGWQQWRYPDEVYRDTLTVELGGERFDLHHGKGETDDHTWVWVASRSMICCGDFFVWVTPNAGNPQKVQRYPLEWARALREMAAKSAEVLVPAHQLPIFGAERVRTALGDAATLLESLVSQSLDLMNRGARLDEVIHSVQAPRALLQKPFLLPLYDEPEFIVRNVWRLYGGWYDANPANLKPAPEAEVAAELAALAGGAGRLAARANDLAAAGNLRLAAHLAEFAALAAPDDPSVHAVRAEVFNERAAAESSLMARGIFSAAASDSAQRAGPSPADR